MFSPWACSARSVASALARASFWDLVRSFPSFLSLSFLSLSFCFFLSFLSASRRSCGWRFQRWRNYNHLPPWSWVTMSLHWPAPVSEPPAPPAVSVSPPLLFWLVPPLPSFWPGPPAWLSPSLCWDPFSCLSPPSPLSSSSCPFSFCHPHPPL